MVGTPLNIRRFEVLQLVSIFLGLIHSLLDGSLIGSVVAAINKGANAALIGRVVGAAIGFVVGIAILTALTLLVSRRRKNWARWALLVFNVLGVSFVVWQGQPRALFSVDFALSTALVWLMQGVALVLVFTPQSGRWLRGDQSKDLRHVFG
jgi:hypothetical protein